jgi:GTPase
MINEAIKDIRFKSGFAGLLGWTNVGKSTLVNTLTGMKIAITADCPQTTRHRLVGIVQSDTYQIALTDTPGIHSPRNELSRRMVKNAWGTMATMDLVIWLVFPDRSAEMQLKAFHKRLKSSTTPLLVAINKIDTVHPDSIIPLADTLCKEIDPIAVVPISAKTGQNIDRFLHAIVDQLPYSDPLYPVEQVTDQPERIIVAEYIREQVIALTYQEMPHIAAVVVDLFKQRESGAIDIAATVFVEKNSQKKIVIGANGSMIKKIGSAAREYISSFLQTKVDLRLWIKVKPGWRNDPVGLRQFGYH